MSQDFGFDDECGFTYDHDAVTVSEDEDGYQWECRRCGAEGWEDAPSDARSES